MNPYVRFARWAGTKRWFPWFGRSIVTRIDSRFNNRSRSLTTFGTDFPMGYLTTHGRKTGKERTVPLLFVESSAGNPVVVGTNWGGKGHPLWVANLEADPSARWKASDEVPVTARRVEGTEFNELWLKLVEIWPGYDKYVERSGRKPRMYELVRSQ